MNRKDFHFDYPEELVAQVPLAERDSARLLFFDGPSRSKQDRIFSELPNVLRETFPATQAQQILLIVNDSKVFPARLRCKRKSGGRAEVFVLSTRDDGAIPCLLRPQKKLRVGEILFTEESGQPAFRVVSQDPPRVENVSQLPLLELLAQEGEMPLPPYIERDPEKIKDPSLAAIDKLRYQTVFAKDVGSAAAPTAGLHFTPAVLAGCAEAGIKLAPVTLHVGLGTFQPVTADQIDDHKMHKEICSVPQATMALIIEHLQKKWPIIFVGTTSFRCVESVLLRAQGVTLSEASKETRTPLFKRAQVEPQKWYDLLRDISGEWIETDLFVRPESKESRYRPAIGQGIITNFHQPESTLAMLIASLLGYESWRQLYAHAIEKEYRLFSYGDSSLLLFPEQS